MIAEASAPEETSSGPPRVTLTDLLATGATYRQVDYWCRSGYLTPDREHPDALPGSGNKRSWTEGDVTLCRWMVRLTRAGLVPSVAAAAAARMVESGRSTVHINGLEITMLEETEW